MKLTLRSDHLKLYRNVALLLMRYGRRDMFETVSLDEALLLETEAAIGKVDGKAEAFADDLERLGPTFIKLGQLLSTRPDLVPADYAHALSRLQDDVEPFSFEQVEAIIQTELGGRLSKLFDRFDKHPLAAASLGQVHRATLRDGREVAVKVQRPDIRKKILSDLDALGDVVDSVAKYTEIGRRYAVDGLLREFRSTLIQELDYRSEAANLERLKHILMRYDRIIVPAPIHDYSTSRVLTMDFVGGVSIKSAGALRRIELDGQALAADLLRAYLDQVLRHGFFHADPHPGNIMIADDGRLALLDLGMVARIGPEMRQQLMKLLIAITEGRGRESADHAIAMSRPLAEFDENGFVMRIERLVTQHMDNEMRDVNVGRLLLEVLRASGETGLQPPSSLAMLGKALLSLDEISKLLAPDVAPREIIRSQTGRILQRQVASSFSPGSLMGAALDLQDLARSLPPRLNTLSDKLADDRFTLRIKALDEPHVLTNAHRMINRLSLAIVLAALIVGAAMLMQIDTEFRFFGYPAFAMILFLAAVGCGFALVVSIFLAQRNDSRNPF